jgi:hypothetical protein
MKTTTERARESVHALGDMPAQLAALGPMSVSQLMARYRELYGEPTHSRNGGYLRKRLAWRIQELAEGGLSPRTLAKIAELGDELPERWRRRRAEPLPEAPATPTATIVSPVPAPASPASKHRDPRLPPIGTVLTRVYEGVAHEVAVESEGFGFGGKQFKTLSAIARQITGTQWNGYSFFGLPKAEVTP